MAAGHQQLNKVGLNAVACTHEAPERIERRVGADDMTLSTSARRPGSNIPLASQGRKTVYTSAPCVTKVELLSALNMRCRHDVLRAGVMQVQVGQPGVSCEWQRMALQHRVAAYRKHPHISTYACIRCTLRYILCRRASFTWRHGCKALQLCCTPGFAV